MSILSTLDDLILRSVSHPPLTTKGSELTYAEWDAHVTDIYDAIQSIVSGVNVTAYDAGTTYDLYDTDIRNRYASYNSRIWQAAYVGSPSTFSGQTPAEGVYWTQVTLAEMLPDVMKVAEMSDSNGVVVKTATLSLSSAQILASNTTPIGFGLTVPAGYHVELLGQSTTITAGTPYATNTQLQLTNGGDAALGTIGNNLLASTVTKVCSAFSPENPSAGQTQVLSATDVFVKTRTGDPTGGTGTALVRIIYVIVED